MLFGQVWPRAELSPQDRSLVTVARLLTGGNTDQLAFHLGLARRNGATETELIEAITHLAFYAGWPKAMSAMAVAKQVFRGARLTSAMAHSERSSTMRGAVLYAPGDVRFEERADPTIEQPDRRDHPHWPPPASAGRTCGPTAASRPSTNRPRWATSTSASSRRSAAT